MDNFSDLMERQLRADVEAVLRKRYRDEAALVAQLPEGAAAGCPCGAVEVMTIPGGTMCMACGAVKEAR